MGRDDAEDGAHGGGGVYDGAAAEGGDDAEGEAEGDAEDEGGGAEAQAVGQAFEDDGGGGDAVAEGVAEVELERFLPEDDVLDDGVLVQPHFAADFFVFFFDLFGGAIGIEVDAEAGGIAGYADQEEDEGNDQEYDEDRLEEAADDEGAHWLGARSEGRGARELLTPLSGGLPPGFLRWVRRQPFLLAWRGLRQAFSLLTPHCSFLVVGYSVGMWISNDLLNDSSGRPGLSA